ncbi:EamA family transporter [Zhihengliuella halotolerans]|uniref:EamA family transporter n=1 Tax=Zhihengliuella halotolerans TaxID=370736 RepID=UPI000C808E05|nr:EamA family transporter [Zhihengliuella halotolerans]
MPPRHRLLAVSVALMWGLNFIAIDASLQVFPPLFLVALRFALLAVPTILLVPRPDVPVRWLLGYGLGFGTLQFLFLYWGMSIGMPAGLASLVLQASAPFTVLLGALFLRERIGPLGIAGITIAVGGLTVVGWQRWESASLLPFLLTLAGAFGWALGNICNRRARPSNPLHLTLWMSVVPPLPMLALSLHFEGPAAIAASFTGLGSAAGLAALAGLAYTVAIGTILGSGVFTWLMSRHPAGVVAPFTLLVPVFGMSAAWLALGERPSAGELAGGVMIVSGVLIGAARRPRLPRRRSAPPAAGPPPRTPAGIHDDSLTKST